jgi:predicted lipoprotein with Yx(FWY)xxD motif
MSMKLHRAFRGVVPAVVLALLVAGCGHKSSPPPRSGTPQSATIKSATVLGVGTILANGGGWTVYMHSTDNWGKAPCTSSACTKQWPPVLLPPGISAPKAGAGARASLLGTTKAPGGTQITYRDWPLYTFSGDKTPGQVIGRGRASFGGVWHMLLPSGKPMPLLVG